MVSIHAALTPSVGEDPDRGPRNAFLGHVAN